MSDIAERSEVPERKRPMAVTLSVILHVLCVLWVLYAFLLFFEIITWRLYIFIGIFLLIHFIGIHGLRTRRRWAKGYSKTVFIFYIVMQFAALSRAARSGDRVGLLVTILIGGFICWLINELNQVEVESYLNPTQKS